jgi:hypothetical protein
VWAIWVLIGLCGFVTAISQNSISESNGAWISLHITARLKIKNKFFFCKSLESVKLAQSGFIKYISVSMQPLHSGRFSYKRVDKNIFGAFFNFFWLKYYSKGPRHGSLEAILGRTKLSTKTKTGDG